MPYQLVYHPKVAREDLVGVRRNVRAIWVLAILYRGNGYDEMEARLGW